MPVIRMSATVRFCFAFSMRVEQVGDQDGGQNADDRDHDQELDQRKARLLSPRVYAS